MSLLPSYELPENRPSELKRDPWLSRCFLQDVDDWILKEAERREDTWQFLLGVPGLTNNSRDFFKAGVSYSKAIDKLIHIDCGGATLNRPLSVWDESLEAEANGDMRKARIKARKIIRGLWANECLTGDSMPPFNSEKERIEVNPVLEIEEKTFRKKYGKDWMERLRLDRGVKIDKSYNETQFMAHAWLRGGLGKPGLCFFTDEAIAGLMTLFFCNENEGDRYDYYRKMRRNLGLKQICCRKPTVKTFRPVPGTRFIEIEYRMTDRLQKHRFEWDRTF